MKSISGNDGSYSLLVSFELGTDPDINTVNVNNRVQIALSKMPEEVKRSGVTGEEEVVGATCGHRFSGSTASSYDPAFLGALERLVDETERLP